MMRARMMVEKPAELEMTLKLTMPMADWELLRDQLTRSYPSWKLSTAITTMLTEARRVYYAPDADCFGDREVEVTSDQVSMNQTPPPLAESD